VKALHSSETPENSNPMTQKTWIYKNVTVETLNLT